MFLLHSMNEHEDEWKQAGMKNRLALFALLDEFIQRDEAFRKIKTRNYALDKRQELDRKLLEARTKRIEKEKHDYAINQSLRILDLEKRRRERIEATNKRFQKMEIEAKERDVFHKKRLQAIYKEGHNKQERERIKLHEKEKSIVIEKSKLKKFRKFNIMQEDKCRAEIDLLKQRINEIEHQKATARAETNKKIQNIDKIQRQKTEYQIKRLRDLERNHENEAFSLVSRINELEMEKQRQKNILSKRNEEFKKELENREKMTSLQRENGEKRKQKYFSRLNSRISKLGKQRDILIYNSKENLSILNEKDKKQQNFVPQERHIIEKEKKIAGDKTERATVNENEFTKNIIDTLQNSGMKSDLYPIKETIPQSDVTSEEISIDRDMLKERERIWDLEAKAREEHRIRDAFTKLMAGLRK